MNQPKFKVGDTLFCKAWNCSFEVYAIRISRHGISYCSEDTDFIGEFECELYQEPKKKMLYAFKKEHQRLTHYDGSVKWTETILMKDLPSDTAINMLAAYERIFRTPDDDIDLSRLEPINKGVSHVVE